MGMGTCQPESRTQDADPPGIAGQLAQSFQLPVMHQTFVVCEFRRLSCLHHVYAY